MFHTTINKFKNATTTSSFASEANYVFMQGVFILNQIEEKKIYNQEALITAHNYVVIGIITLAQLVHDWKYSLKEEACPKEGMEIIHAIKEKCRIELFLSRIKSSYPDENWHDCVMMIGKSVLIDKTIPLYPTTKRFANAGLDIEKLLIPQAQIADIPVPKIIINKDDVVANTSNTSSSVFQFFGSFFSKSAPQNIVYHPDKIYSEMKGPGIVMPMFKI